MTGETNLAILLQEMEPVLDKDEYVFCSFLNGSEKALQVSLGMFREKEGITFIMQKTAADELRLAYNRIYRWITLTVHSSLEAVGLTAAFSTALAREGISCNVVAGFYHDHIFVGEKDANKAMTVLQKMKGIA